MAYTDFHSDGSVLVCISVLRLLLKLLTTVDTSVSLSMLHFRDVLVKVIWFVSFSVMTISREQKSGYDHYGVRFFPDKVFLVFLYFIAYFFCKIMHLAYSFAIFIQILQVNVIHCFKTRGTCQCHKASGFFCAIPDGLPDKLSV
jgi:hypothetical protein